MARIHIKVEPGRINVEQGRWEAIARDPNGPILRDLIRRGNNVETTMRFDAPRRTGLLAATIRTQIDNSGRLPSVDIVAGRSGMTDYLGYVIEGTRPHIISAKPNRPNPHLRFIARSGAVVFRRSVAHPGTRADTFMQRALLRAAD